MAVLASCALNGSYLLQHAGSRDLPAIDARRPGRTIRALASARLWLAGGALGLIGWALHIGALARAPLSLVQAFSAGGLALTAPVAARLLGEPLLRREKAAVGMVAVGLALLGIGAATPAPTAVPAATLGTVLGLVAATAAVIAARAQGPRRARALGLAGGALYGAADAATKALTWDAHVGGLAGALSSPWLAAVLLLSGGAFLTFQRGLQIGPAVPVVAVMTAVTNGFAIAIGIVVLGDPLGTTPAARLLHLAAFGLAIAGAWVLAAAEGRLGEAGPHSPTRAAKVA
jgi:drug/metabolite transporter (DMT)-like permease